MSGNGFVKVARRAQKVVENDATLKERNSGIASTLY